MFKRTTAHAPSHAAPDIAPHIEPQPASQTAPQPPDPAPHLSLTVSSDTHQLQGYLYCAALSVHRAVAGVETGRDADYLFAALANLQQLAMKLQVANADLADITVWQAQAEARMRDLRKKASFRNSAPKPIVQIDASVRAPENIREIA